MSPERHRRLLRRLLRRRPLLPFLLMALAAVDAAILVASREENTALDTLVWGFVTAQVGLLAIWATRSWRRLAPRLVVALLALVPVTFVVQSTMEVGHAILLTVVLEVFAACLVAAGAVRLAVGWFDPRGLRSRRRRFSIADLLWAMLLVALACALARLGAWRSAAAPEVLQIVAADGMMTAVVLFLASLRLGPVFRSALLGWLPMTCLAWSLAVAQVYGEGTYVYYAAQLLALGCCLLMLTPTVPRRSAPKREEPLPPQEFEGPATIPLRFDAVV